jgi:hypothetical protein
MTEAAQEAPVEETAAPATEETAAPETLFDGVEPAGQESSETQARENDPERPAWLPEKFKTPEDLAKSYSELEERMREGPKPPDSYDLKDAEGEALDLSEEDVAAFREAKLNEDQAQKVVDYFYDIIVPEITEARAEAQRSNLANEWGVKADSEQFQRRLAQVKAWANQNLPDSMTAELSRTAAGVNSIFKMMESGASVNSINGQQANSRPDKMELQKLMDDPRYWTDDSYKNEVRKKFQEAFD